jgi:hypothetical protein
MAILRGGERTSHRGDTGATFGAPGGSVPRMRRFPPTTCIVVEEANQLVRRVQGHPARVRPVIIRDIRARVHNPGLRNKSGKEPEGFGRSSRGEQESKPPFRLVRQVGSTESVRHPTPTRQGLFEKGGCDSCSDLQRRSHSRRLPSHLLPRILSSMARKLDLECAGAVRHALRCGGPKKHARG